VRAASPVAPELEIRRLQSDDLDRIFSPGGRPHGEWWLERQRQSEVHVAVAELAGVPVGRVGLDFVQEARAGAARLWAAHVEPGYQSRGIGSALMLHLEGVARERGCTLIRLAVGKENPRARRLYERLGYQVCGEEVNRWTYLKDGRWIEEAEDCWTMEKPLPP
jgi:ribosomal protein S18 acetylase RimI-like enzyme